MATKRRQFELQERELTLHEYEAGLISRDEYRRTLKRRRKSPSPEPIVTSPEPISNAMSPDWDFNQLNDDMHNSSDFDTLYC